ncbi:MAG: DUF2336 domain-containing protein [Rhodospirillales bacterium]|nr:DUF2336 domain-containing protein [Rhodospirillales bacterium]
MKGLLQRLFKGGTEEKPITYDEAKEMARHEDPGVRGDLAARSDVKPEILYFLAEDPEPDVRRTIATNMATPVQADLLLASDADQDVRGDLAEKIASLASGLSADDQDKVRRLTYEALDILARDQVTRVRQILSEALKDVADAPPEVIRQLAWDAELVVAGPILQFSPVLNEEDLLEIINSSPASGHLGAISRRHGLKEPVTAAIVETVDEEVIAMLLANASAQIREETLENIIARAPDIEPWHEPLVNRPILPGKAAGKLARFVAHNLLEALSDRQDLEPEVLEEVRQIVDRRLEEEPSEMPEEEKTTAEEALAKVKALQAAGTLDEPSIVKAARSGDREFAIAALSVLSGLKVGVVRKAISSKSAKGMVALTWKAGLSAQAAETLQGRLALVPQKELLRAKGGGFPMDESAMEWQLDFIKDLG